MNKDSKTIWLINQYGSTPETGMGGRHYYFAQELAKQGHNVYLITASNTHLLRQPPVVTQAFEVVKKEGFNLVWVRVPFYTEAHSKRRIANWFRFAWQVRKLMHVIPDKPDAIVYSSPSLIGFLGAERLAKFFKVPLTFEVRDIWPLTLTEIGGYSPGHPFIRFLQWIEDRAYRVSDHVVSNLKNAADHMTVRGMPPGKFNWVPNGFSLSEVTSSQPLPAEVKERLPNDKFIIGYTGTLGIANALDTLINAADELKAYRDVAFVIVGSGKAKVKLQDIVTKKNLHNVIFIDAIPKAQIQSMLKKFEVCYIGLTKDPLFRFGVSPNKLFDYLYSGKPIVYAIDSGDFRPIEELGAGLTVPPEQPGCLADAILKLYRLSPAERMEMGRKGYKAVVEQYEYSALAQRWASIILG